MKSKLILFLIFAAVILYAYSTGITGLTNLNGEGCVCHNLEPDINVHVWIIGPDTLIAGETAEYKLYLTGGPAIRGGFNTAARFGTLTIADSGEQKIDNELAHTFPRSFINDTIIWRFNYTAPEQLTDTIYAVSISVNNDGIPSTDDKWNFAPNFPLVIEQPLPVELTSFNANAVNNKITLNWSTASEINNYGFEVERIAGSQFKNNWEKIGFVKGNGSSTAVHNYSFSDYPENNSMINYRLKQIDYNGNFDYSETIEIEFNQPNKFSLEQNYPNPFNPTTIIKFTTPDDMSSAPVLTIFDILGNKIDEFILESKSGSHEIDFDGSRISSGVYIYKLTADSKSLSRKMILSK
jgi:hypothetical protein